MRQNSRSARLQPRRPGFAAQTLCQLSLSFPPLIAPESESGYDIKNIFSVRAQAQCARQKAGQFREVRMLNSQTLMTKQQLADALAGFSQTLSQNYGNCENLVLVGIQRRGVDIARRVASMLNQRFGKNIPCGSLDITLYRDDWTTTGPKPQVAETNLPVSIEGKNVVLIDDVIFSGRTIRAALGALVDFGRPRKVELYALVDRGHRELPIHPDYTSLKIPTQREDMVDVRMVEHDGQDGVFLITV